MKHLFKRNQIIITALAIMIAVAGYLNYANNNIPTGLEKNTTKDKKVQKEEDTTVAPGDAVYTSANISSYIADSRLAREQARAKSKEALSEIVNSTATTEEQRQEAVNKMMQLAEMSEKEAAAENLLKAQGYENVVVSVSADEVNAVMDMTDVDDASRAKIEDAIKRATDYSADKIIITPINEN